MLSNLVSILVFLRHLETDKFERAAKFLLRIERGLLLFNDTNAFCQDKVLMGANFVRAVGDDGIKLYDDCLNLVTKDFSNSSGPRFALKVKRL